MSEGYWRSRSQSSKSVERLKLKICTFQPARFQTLPNREEFEKTGDVYIMWNKYPKYKKMSYIEDYWRMRAQGLRKAVSSIAQPNQLQGQAKSSEIARSLAIESSLVFSKILDASECHFAASCCISACGSLTRGGTLVWLMTCEASTSTPTLAE